MNRVFDVHNALKESVQAPKGKEQQHTQKHFISWSCYNDADKYKRQLLCSVTPCHVVENTKDYVTFREIVKK